jgi:hypothetical protein
MVQLDESEAHQPKEATRIDLNRLHLQMNSASKAQ